MEEQFLQPRTGLQELAQSVTQLKQEIGKVIVGQEHMVEFMLAAMLADGHILIEGVPGVAKTLAAKLMSRCIAVDFSRIQFTPDLMPSDVIGTSVFNPRESAFQFKKGPVFSHIILIDEINRAPAKTQAALFEVMEERQVTVDGHTYPLELPFMVMATQNPVEQEGTYHLPEAQVDRFLFKFLVDYPTAEEELQVLKNQHAQDLPTLIARVQPVLSAGTLMQLRKRTREVHAEPHLLEFIVRVVAGTRTHKSIYLGASPRASLGIMNGAKAIAAMRGRDFLTPEDILYVTPAVLRHRIVLSPEKEMEGASPDDIINAMLQTLEIPR